MREMFASRCVSTAMLNSWMRSARRETSLATTAKPRPCSPARAASIDAAWFCMPALCVVPNAHAQRDDLHADERQRTPAGREKRKDRRKQKGAVNYIEETRHVQNRTAGDDR